MKVFKFFTTIFLLSAILFSCSLPGGNSGNTNNEPVAVATSEALPTAAEVDAALTSSNRVVSEGYILIDGKPVLIGYEKLGNVNLFEGDIVIPNRDIFSTAEEALGQAKVDNISKAVVNTSRLWTNKTVYYQIASNVYDANAIRQAISRLQSKTGIRFIEQRSTNYIEFIPSSGSWSYIGMVGGKQQIGLATWAKVGTTVHEIMHALGVHHEHSRGDRDNYVTIHWNNIKSGSENNFRKRSGAEHRDIGAFDFGSIMIYGCYGFSKNGQPTITKKDGSTYQSQRNAMSATDIQGLKFLYPGNGGGDTQAPTVPTSLRKGSVTSSSVAISWTRSTDNVRVTGYKVYVNGSFNKTVTSTSTTVSGLNSSTTYSFAVSAIDAAGNESRRSSSISATTSKGGGGGTTTWKAWTAYKVGDVVTYSGVKYTCIFAHTAYPGWEPNKVPVLWRPQ